LSAGATDIAMWVLESINRRESNGSLPLPGKDESFEICQYCAHETLFPQM
jgi:hypothetical protein